MPSFEGENSPYNVIDGVKEGRVVATGVAYGGRRWPLCLHSWRGERLGIWYYRECKKCGRRQARRTNFSLMGPVDLHWVLTGEHREMRPPAPAKLVEMKPADAGRSARPPTARPPGERNRNA